MVHANEHSTRSYHRCAVTVVQRGDALSRQMQRTEAVGEAEDPIDLCTRPPDATNFTTCQDDRGQWWALRRHWDTNGHGAWASRFEDEHTGTRRREKLCSVHGWRVRAGGVHCLAGTYE